MRFYYGWGIVAIAVLVLTLVVGASIHAFGLFVLPVSEAFGLSRAGMNTGIILLNFGMAVAAPLLGGILDRRSARTVTAVCALLFGGSLILLGISHDIRLSAFVLAVPLAIAVVGCGTLTSTALVARWFTAQRGRAMAIAAIGISLGPLVVVPLIGVLIPALGWRESLMALGAAVGVLVLLMVPLIRDRPGDGDVEGGSRDLPAGQPAPLPPAAGATLGIGELLRLPQFWTISLSAALAFGIQQTIVVSLVPYAQGHGLTITEAASLVSVFGGMAILGKLMLAWLGDRFDRPTLLGLLFALLGAASASLMAGQGYAVILACSALLGLAAGATTPGFLALVADRCGAAAFGTASGAASFISTLISAACIRFGGEVYDRTGSYRAMFLTFIVLALISAALMFATGRFGREKAMA